MPGMVTGCPMMARPSRNTTRKDIEMSTNTKAAAQAAQAESAQADINTADDNTMELTLSSDRFAALDISADIAGGTGAYCSMTAASDRDKVTLYNACSNPKRLSDMLNLEIKMKHVFAEIIQVMSEASGEMVNVPRVVIIDEKGQGYQAVSLGIYNSVKRILSLFGDPASWDHPHTVRVQNINLQNGQHTFNLIMVD